MHPIDQPFRSEAYDRLMLQQAKHHDVSAVLDSRNVGLEEVLLVLKQPIATGEALKSARAKLGWSQARVSEAFGTDAPKISLMENDKAPIPPAIDLAMRALLAQEVAP